MSTKQLKNVNEIQAEINRLEAQKIKIESRYTFDNTCTLIEEVMNYIDGVGNGFTEGDYCAQSRYYSSIPGVKNFRFGHCGDNDIIIKSETPRGELLPNTIEVRDVVYNIVYNRSKNFGETLDY